MNAPEIRRGEVWWISFDPSLHGEIQKTRPAIVISNDAANRHLNRVQVVPLTSKSTHLYPGEAFVSLNGNIQKALADQLATVAKQRLREKMGVLGRDDLLAVERAIRTQLAL